MLTIRKYIENIFRSNKNRIHFTQEYRNGYSNLWINNIKNYSP